MEPSGDQHLLENDYEYTCRVCMVTDNNKKFHTLLEEPLKSRFEECTSIEVSGFICIVFWMPYTRDTYPSLPLY